MNCYFGCKEKNSGSFNDRITKKFSLNCLPVVLNLHIKPQVQHARLKNMKTGFLKMGHFIFVLSIQLTVNNVQYKCLPMTRFELWTSGIGNDRSTNWATTTAQTREQLYLLRNGYLPNAHQFLVNFITFSSAKVFKLASMVSWFARPELVRVWIPFTVEIFI